MRKFFLSIVSLVARIAWSLIDYSRRDDGNCKKCLHCGHRKPRSRFMRIPTYPREEYITPVCKSCFQKLQTEKISAYCDQILAGLVATPGGYFRPGDVEVRESTVLTAIKFLKSEITCLPFESRHWPTGWANLKCA